MKQPKHIRTFLDSITTVMSHYQDGLYSEAELVQAVHTLATEKGADLVERYHKDISRKQEDINNLMRMED